MKVSVVEMALWKWEEKVMKWEGKMYIYRGGEALVSAEKWDKKKVFLI